MPRVEAKHVSYYRRWCALPSVVVLGLVVLGLVVPGLVVPGLVVPGLVVPGLVVPGLVVPGLVVPGLVVPGLVVPGLVVPGLVVPGLVVTGIVHAIENIVKNIILFFVEADIDAAGNRVDKGLYVYKNGGATKLLENGRDAAASSDNSTDVFFGAKDGIYMYDNKENKAVKYGSVTDDIIAIAKENAIDVIYYLNKDHELYKVTDNGQKNVKIDDVVGAHEIVLDTANNLYFYTEDKQVYVVNENGVKKITGLPEHPKSVKLIKPPVLEDGAVFLSDNAFYIIYSNGTSELSDFEITSIAKPSAYAMEATIVQFYAFHKKIYKYNLLEILSGDIFETLNKFLEENQEIIQNASPVSKSSTRNIKKHKQI